MILVMANISFSSYEGKVNGKFSSKYSGLLAYNPFTNEVGSSLLLLVVDINELFQDPGGEGEKCGAFR